MPSNRSDLLKVCNDQNVPLDQFKMTFCDRCMQTECTRSRVGQSKFEKRVGSWYENLFANPPRLDPSDSRYETISGKKFLMIDPGPAPEVWTSSWVDPRDLNDKEAVKPASIQTETKGVAEPFPVPAHPLKLERSQLIRLPTLNTPDQGPRMVGNVLPQEKKDAWEVAEPEKTNEKVVSPGSKVRFRSTPGV
jgi:hypothetical protein